MNSINSYIKNVKQYISINYVSFIFGIFIAFFPWEIVRHTELFIDLRNYVDRIEDIRVYGFYYIDLGSTWVDYFKNEYVWFLIIYIISNSFLDPLFALKLISSFCGFVYHKYLASSVGNTLAFILLLNPIAIGLINAQIRSALAFSVFLLLITVINNKKLRVVMLPIVIFIHSGMLFILATYIFTVQISKAYVLSPVQKIVIVAISAFIAALLLNAIVPEVLESIDDRRLYIQYSIVSASYVAFWVFWSFILIVSYNEHLQFDWPYYYGVFICLSVPTMVIIGFPGFRLFAMSLPIVFMCLPKLAINNYRTAIVSICLYQVLQFYYWGFF